MDVALKPIKRLVVGSIVLHIVGLSVAMIFLVFLQRPLWPVFTGRLFPEESTVFFPSLIVMAPIAMVFILHCCLTIGFVRMIGCRNGHLKQLRMFSVVSLIAVSTVFPIIYFVWGYFEHFLAFRNIPTSYDVFAFSVLQNLMAFGLVIRGISMSVLLIAASMSWYYCFMKGTKGKEACTFAEVNPDSLSK